MSLSKRKNGLRPLGSLRLCTNHKQMNISGSALSTPQNSRVTKSHESTGEHKLRESHTTVIIKSKASPTCRTSPKCVKVDKCEVGEATVDDQVEAPDAKLHEEIVRLENLLEVKSNLLRVKDGEVNSLEESLATQEEYYRDLYEKERTAHTNTQQLLGDTEDRLVYIEQQMSCQRKQYEDKLRELEQKLIHNLEDLRTSKNQEIEDLQESNRKEVGERDNKIKKLKVQMAEILKGNSWERQQQLEELSKELTRMQEEADELRMALRFKDNKMSCSNCASLQDLVEQTKRAISQKEQAIRELNDRCVSFSQQLQKYEQQNGNKRQPQK